MPFETITLIQEPTESSPEDSGPHLAEFVRWLHEFINEINREIITRGNVSGMGGLPLFEDELIHGLPMALAEIHVDGQFERLEEELLRAPTPERIQMVREHGLYGAQLKWKLSNINIRLERFLIEQTAPLLHRLLSSVDILLESLLGAVPGGSAIKELKEMIEDALALVAPTPG